jgi:mannosyl-oligosaccharide alpha-1,2-mannosidase
MFRGARIKRTRLIAIALAVAICYLLFSPGTIRESARLVTLMNAKESLNAVPLSPSSFNWSTVNHEFAPKDLVKVPSSKNIRLPPVQFAFARETSQEREVRESRRDQVRQTFQRDWAAYRKFAWMKDALLPVSGGFKDQFSGWAATLVDSLDTLWIMGLKPEFDEAVAAVAQIDFGNSTSTKVNTFETNIRYMGGLLSAYDLSKRPVLLAKATELGDLLYTAFNTESRMPVDFIDFATAKTGQGLILETRVVSASPGSLSLEMTRLSQVTGNPKYYTAISRLMDLFYQNQNRTSLPGLWPMMVSMRQLDVRTGSQFTLAGNADSLYEYLPKMHGLLQGAEPKYDTMSRSFFDAANKTMFFRPMLPDNDDILISGNVNIDSDGQPILDPETEHLACYLGGAFALGGRLLSRPDDVDIGAKLTKGCIYAYKSFPSGVGPERWNMIACDSRSNCTWDEDAWVEGTKKRREWKAHLPKGFTTAKDPRYILRPEAIESVFILHRITGRQEFQDAAWDMFQAVRNATHTPLASGAIRDVTIPVDTSTNEDYMEVR